MRSSSPGTAHGTAPQKYADVSVAYVDANNKVTSVEPFLTGLVKDNQYLGRPVDVLVMPDGSLLVSDDHAGAIYRVSYGKLGRRSVARRRLAASALAFLLRPAFRAWTIGQCACRVAAGARLPCARPVTAPTGQSENPEVPHIGGQPKLFVMYQLFFYREGRRKSPEMNTVAKDMSDAELTALSDYVAGLPPPPPALAGTIDEARYQRGAEMAGKRICGSCHNPDFSGREQMPRLAGQREAYLLKSFKEYQAGAPRRHPGRHGRGGARPRATAISPTSLTIWRISAPSHLTGSRPAGYSLLQGE